MLRKSLGCSRASASTPPPSALEADAFACLQALRKLEYHLAVLFILPLLRLSYATLEKTALHMAKLFKMSDLYRLRFS